MTSFSFKYVLAALLLASNVIAQRETSVVAEITSIPVASGERTPTLIMATPTATDMATSRRGDTSMRMVTTTSFSVNDTMTESSGTKATTTGRGSSGSMAKTTATVATTIQPDLNGAGVSLQDPGFMALGMAFGLMTFGMALL